MDSNDEHGDDEPIGYGRPPRYTRFRKGQSGNPRGRPRKEQPDPPVPLESPHIAAILKVGKQTLPGKVAGKSYDMTYIEAIVQKQAAIALGGNHNAQRDFIMAYGKAEKEEAAFHEARQQARQREIDEVIAWRRNIAAIWEKASRHGREPEDPWPHADDILIDHSKLSWKVRGPLVAGDVPFFELLRAQRDLHMVNEALAWFAPGAADRKSARAEFHHLLWLIHEQLLPERWQIPPKRAELWIDWLVLRPSRDVRELHQKCEARVRALRRHDRTPTKADYARVNQIMKPLLRASGYRSLAHFDSCQAAQPG